MFVFAATATTFANSVLPEPGGPSARIGFCILAARNTTFRVTGSATYLAATSFSDNCSIDANTGCAPAALILNHNQTGSLFFLASKCLEAGDPSQTSPVRETAPNHSRGRCFGCLGSVRHAGAHSYTMTAANNAHAGRSSKESRHYTMIRPLWAPRDVTNLRFAWRRKVTQLLERTLGPRFRVAFLHNDGFTGTTLLIRPRVQVNCGLQSLRVFTQWRSSTAWLRWQVVSQRSLWPRPLSMRTCHSTGACSYWSTG